MAFPSLLCILCLAVAGAVGPTIRATPELKALQRTAEERLGRYDRALGGGPDLLIALGQVPEAGDLVTDAEVKGLKSDAFILRSRNVSNQLLVVCAGRSIRAVGYAFFEFLQFLGFGFLHPLKPVLPDGLPKSWQPLDVHESPRWAFRGSHYHTQHPLELTNLLNGYDDQGQTEDRQRWALALDAWEDYLNWLLAQKQNYVEWMLLADRRRDQTSNFELSDERHWRLKTLVQAAHDKGLEVGVDVPLSLKQQHALNLLPSTRANHEEEVRFRLRWLISVGFDHLGTELGSTEFTRGLRATEMIHLLNVAQEELGSDRKLLVKNHCSSNQFANGFQDPRPGMEGQTLNFNYLNYFANPQIVSMPHTVQAYSLLDPAPTYGNSNFSDLRNWTSFLLHQGRPVVFYPETAYWVNYDISVPLFLAPLYSLDRVEDAETIDAMGGTPPLGQLNFESGWQFGYWLANSVQALAAWRPVTLTQAFQRLLRFLGPQASEALAELLVDYATAQRRLLILGRRQGGLQTLPAPGVGQGSATGIAYLQGSEGLSDFASMMARYLGEGAPQPDRLHLMELQRETPVSHRVFRAVLQAGADVFGSELWQRQQWFQEHLRPLLTEMNSTFANLAKRFEDFQSLPQVDDLTVSAQLLSLRSSQVLALYEYAALCREPADAACANLGVARAALRSAEALVQQRSQHMGLERLGPGGRRLVLEWGEPVPTAYSYGYLWAAHTLFYWHRDQDMVEQEIWELCFRSINDPVDLGLPGGGGPWAHWAQSVAQSFLSNRLWHFKLSECLGPPTEPKQGDRLEEAIVM